MIIANGDSVKAVETKDEIVGKGPVMKKGLIDAKESRGFGVSLVTFSPGARLNPHTHTYEQILVITDGKCIVATPEQEQIVGPGTVVFFPPGEVHWHGATADSPGSHLSISKPGIQLAPQSGS